MNEEYEFYVAGVKFHELRKCVDDLEVGDILQLEQEPDNKYDINAVKILSPKFYAGEGGVEETRYMLGYVPAKISAQVTAAMDLDSQTCTIIELNKSEKPWKMLKVQIKLAEG